jgi:oligogalacturonide lyase
MNAGREWPPEWRESKDPETGVRVRQLTDYKGHSHHVYFTNNGWYDGGRKLLFGSDRDNRTNLFSIDLDSGAIRQLTDLDPVPKPFETGFLATTVHPRRPEVCFWYGRDLTVLDLDSLELRSLWTTPEGFVRSMINYTADGRAVCGAIFEDLSPRLRIDYVRGYVGFAETHEAHPTSRVFRAAADGSGAETVWEEGYWIGHVNTSPTHPNLLTFCHEGPWDRVDNRIWGLDLTDSTPWKIRPREGDEHPGHEYWYADGERIGYHGRRADGSRFFGRIRYDNTDRVEGRSLGDTGHTHSNDHTLIVGDGGRDSPGVKLWKWNGADYDGPRLLCTHRSSFHVQIVHVHPRFNADASRVLFTSDRSGYGNLYLADLPPFEELPEVK